MTIQKTTVYTVECDGCEMALDEVTEYYAPNREEAEESASRERWTKVGRKHYCSVCTEERKRQEEDVGEE